jgi:hypothetical protein
VLQTQCTDTLITTGYIRCFDCIQLLSNIFAVNCITRQCINQEAKGAASLFARQCTCMLVSNSGVVCITVETLAVTDE